MTMSDSGPAPRSHSPVPFASRSRSIRAVLFAEFVAQLGSQRIVVFGDGSRQLSTEPPSNAVIFHAVRCRIRAFARMPRPSVQAFDERQKLLSKDIVVARAAKTSFPSKFQK